MEFTGERFVPLDSLLNDEMAFEHFHRYHAAGELVKNKVVLDIASGEGFGAAILAKSATKVYGVDIDKEAIKHAAKKYAADTKIEFITGSVDNIPIPDSSIDVVVSYETIEHINESAQEKFLQEIKRVLKKDGKLVVSTPDKENYSKRYDHVNEFHVKEFTRGEFFDFLSNHFDHVHAYLQGYEVVSAITETEPQNVKALQATNWDRTTHPFSRKYLIGVCSDKPLVKSPDFSSVVFQVNKDFMQMTDRMAEMEAHILELGAWGKRLDQEIAEKNSVFDGKVQELENSVAEKDKRLELQQRELQGRVDLINQLQDEKSRWIQNESFFKDTIKRQADTIRIVVERESTSHREFDARVSDKENQLRHVNSELQALKNLHGQLEENKAEIERQIAEKNLTIKNQADEILASKSTYVVLGAELKKAKQQLHNANEVVAGFRKEGADYENIVQELRQQIDLQKGQLDLVNFRLAEIYESEGWKLLRRYYNVKGKVLPEDSKRYRALKNFVNRLRGKKETALSFNTSNNIPLVEETVVAREEGYEVIEFPSFVSPSVSIVIPAYNGWPLTYKCLASIKANTYGISYEVIIADDASSDDTKNIQEYIKNIVVVRNEENLEFLYNCNRAAAYAKGKYLLFLNNDTEVKADWLSSMIDLLENDPMIGMVGSKLVYPDGKLQEAGGILWKDGSAWNFGHNQDPDAPEFNYVKEVDYISGASIIIRTDLWKQIGGFDKRYAPAYCEDSDLAFEVRKHGRKVVYQPLSEVVHFEGYTHGTDKVEGIKGSEIKAYQKLNNEKFKEKWKEVLQKEHFPNGENVFWARDKRQGQKTILVVDHYVPQFDKDAGSRTVFQYLRLFVSLGLNVKFIGDNFYRHTPYTTILQQMGIEVLYGSYYAQNWQQWILDNKDKFDFVLLNRPHITIKYLDFFRENTEAKLFYYGHDLHFVREQRQYEIEKDPKLLESSKKWLETETYIFNHCDVILTPSEEESNTINGVLGNSDKTKAILPYFFERASAAITDFPRRRDVVFIGGFTHKPNVDAVIWFVKEVWPTVKREIPAIRFLVVGSNAPREITELSEGNIDVKGFVTDDELSDIYSRIKIMVVPLRYGAGVKGKVIEAMYHGVPLVTTDFGIEGLPGDVSFISHKNDPSAFAAELIDLYNSNDRLVGMSKSEADYINEHFQMSSARRRMSELLNS